MSLADENRQILMLVQSMLRSVSANFRIVTLDLRGDGGVDLYFVLERDDPEDRECIEDIAFEFDALQEGPARKIDVTVLVSDRPYHEIAVPGRRVFGRREGGC